MELSDRILKFELDGFSSLLINPITGAIDVAPKQILDDMPDSAKEHLDSRGYFFSEDERTEILRGLQSTYEQHSQNVPYWFYVLTTLNCNFGCPICYEKQTLENSETTPQKLEKIIKTVSEFQEEHKIPSERMNLVIFGGEPLCASDPNVVRQIFDTSVQHNWKDVIVTNGSRAKRFIDMFVEYSNTISDFRVTLDGPQSIHDARRPYRGGRGSFNDVVDAIELLLENNLRVKMQTILGSGNIQHYDELMSFVDKRGWLQYPNFEWRIEGSHDYANLDPEKDEISEGKIVQKLIQSWEEHPELHGKLKFESFKYLGHITRSFGWLGEYKTYWGPKFGFCEPQKDFHYVFSTDGNIYHCPRTINNPDFYVGNTKEGVVSDEELKHKTILDREDCLPCSINTLCGGGCVVQKKYHPQLNCKEYASSVISEFVDLMKSKILERANPTKIVPINDLW
ncbi:MAG: 4Fe-4S cluster-binding domain-containing protein [archaeon]|nr:4Fe-4S cluster-binding domain-containing protein [archaeon]